MKTVPKILLIPVVAGLLSSNALAVSDNDIQRALKARDVNDYGFIDMVAFCSSFSNDVARGSGKDFSDKVPAGVIYNIFSLPENQIKYILGQHHFIRNIAKITTEELLRLPLYRKMYSQFNNLLHQASDEDAISAITKPYTKGCIAISAKLVSIGSTKAQSVAAQDAPKSSNNNIKSNISSSSHEKCLDARDYEGCMRVKSSGGSSALTTDPCRGNFCEVKVSGNDSFGLPKPMGGWYYLKADDKIYYYSKVFRVPHKGQPTRYVGMKRITRYYQNPEAGTSGQYLGFGGNTSTTNCTEYNDSINCSTTGSRRIYIPGEEGTPGGVRSASFDSVYDCKDNTYASYKGGRLMYGGWKNTRTGWATQLFDTCKKGKSYIEGLKTLNVRM